MYDAYSSNSKLTEGIRYCDSLWIIMNLLWLIEGFGLIDKFLSTEGSTVQFGS